ncbi:AP2/ERF and B3 domain-containing transcription factor At1g51120-like [Coffea eugenioides]|uniref:AP2/ERF and B3 domain-containing transcription factor At1g51120-like n=1 Tax=Coffea eugenioides TaxID=49369 RepID=UPI000F60AC3F|nr:AP2/ERF and B3 domain-containing transcription factor At1g51120-like [Coffea eugenioides]
MAIIEVASVTMQEESEICGTATNSIQEIFDSNSSSHLIQNKRQKQDTDVASTRFKGVVAQRNGHWGAQIYAHDRIWLGTFKSEIDAAMAYDSAAIKLRGGDSYRNFPWTSITKEEPKFQSQFSTQAVLNMIKDGSYPTKFVEYLRAQSFVQSFATVPSNEGFLCKKLFHKELTPSDVGKLNRLVIPKKYALMYFPRLNCDVQETDQDIAGEDDAELVFFDTSMRSWKFRYCYWKSSQSFVFTRGWNKFVRDKGLRAKDLVIFSQCEFRDGSDELQSVLMIDGGFHESFDGALMTNSSKGENNLPEMEQNGSVKGGLKLFGVQII